MSFDKIFGLTAGWSAYFNFYSNARRSAGAAGAAGATRVFNTSLYYYYH